MISYTDHISNTNPLSDQFGKTIQLLETKLSSPEFDIVSMEQNRFALVISVAGFRPDDFEITHHPGMLKIHAKKSTAANQILLYRGIDIAQFQLTFSLGHYLVVSSARLKNGLLTIEFENQIPDAMKPKKIPIVEFSEDLQKKVAYSENTN